MEQKKEFICADQEFRCFFSSTSRAKDSHHLFYVPISKQASNFHTPSYCQSWRYFKEQDTLTQTELHLKLMWLALKKTNLMFYKSLSSWSLKLLWFGAYFTRESLSAFFLSFFLSFPHSIRPFPIQLTIFFPIIYIFSYVNIPYTYFVCVWSQPVVLSAYYKPSSQGSLLEMLKDYL